LLSEQRVTRWSVLSFVDVPHASAGIAAEKIDVRRLEDSIERYHAAVMAMWTVGSS